MRKLRSILIFILAMSMGFTACKKDKTSEGNGNITFGIGSSLKSVSANDSANVSSVIVTIVNQQNQVVVESKKIELYSFGTGMVSESLQLEAGLYKLTKFLVVDSYDSIIYAAPISGAEKAKLVTTPLYIDFVIADNSTVQITPEVLATTNSNPESFGYASFGYSVVEYLTFKVQAYASDSTDSSYYSYTSAQLNVRYLGNSGDSLSLSPLTATLLTGVNSVDVRKVPNYELIFSKTGYKTIYRYYSADSLVTFYNSPMKIYLTRTNSGNPPVIDTVPPIDSTATGDSSIVMRFIKHRNIGIGQSISSNAEYAKFEMGKRTASANELTFSICTRQDYLSDNKGVIAGNDVTYGTLFNKAMRNNSICLDGDYPIDIG
jgi:hypothetical protein